MLITPCVKDRTFLVVVVVVVFVYLQYYLFIYLLIIIYVFVYIGIVIYVHNVFSRIVKTNTNSAHIIKILTFVSKQVNQIVKQQIHHKVLLELMIIAIN